MLRTAMNASGRTVSAPPTSTQAAHDEACPSRSAPRRLIKTATNASASTQNPAVNGAVGIAGCHSPIDTARIRTVESDRKLIIPSPKGVNRQASPDSGNTAASAIARRRSSGVRRSRQRNNGERGRHRQQHAAERHAAVRVGPHDEQQRNRPVALANQPRHEQRNRSQRDQVRTLSPSDAIDSGRPTATSRNRVAGGPVVSRYDSATAPIAITADDSVSSAMPPR